MNTGLSGHVFPPLRAREVSGAGDEEVFETKASPPAVAGPLTAAFLPPSSLFSDLPVHGQQDGRFHEIRQCGGRP
jgi:hypothetical protein